MRGLWGRDRAARPGSWRTWAEREGIVVGNQVVADKAALMARAMALKPTIEANDADLPGQDTDLVRIVRSPRPQLTIWPLAGETLARA